MVVSTGILPSPNRVVVLMVAGIGNALMTQPMVRQLRIALPHARVVVVAKSKAMAEPFLRLAAPRPLDDVRIASKSSAALIRTLRDERADWLVIPFPSNRWQYNALAVASGAKHVLVHGYPPAHAASMGWSSVFKRVHAQNGIHDVLQNLQLIRAAGLDVDLADAPNFNVTDDELAQADALLENGSQDHPHDNPIVVIHAGSAKTILAAAKRWPPENYARLIDEISKRNTHRIVLVEGPDEVGIAQHITSLLQHARVGKALQVIPLNCPLGVSAGVLKRAQLYIGTDSGLAHLAAAVGTRAVTLFAPADPDRVCPFGQRDRVIQPPVSCAPCFLYPYQSARPAMRCSAPMCVQKITVESVIEQANRELNASFR